MGTKVYSTAGNHVWATVNGQQYPFAFVPDEKVGQFLTDALNTAGATPPDSIVEDLQDVRSLMIAAGIESEA